MVAKKVSTKKKASRKSARTLGALLLGAGPYKELYPDAWYKKVEDPEQWRRAVNSQLDSLRMNSDFAIEIGQGLS
jgi:hypothetical protein